MRLAALACLACASLAATGPAQPLVIKDLKAPSALLRATSEGDERITSLLREAITRDGIPAAGAIVLSSQGPIALGVAGTRKHGVNIPVTIGDKWHLGSNTKAMTATLVAMQVERGKLRWDSTMGEVFAGVPDMNEAMRGVTIEQLVTHHGGCGPNLPWALLPVSGTLPDARLDAMEALLQTTPPRKPGGEAAYSNTGYVLLGTVIETIEKKSWEEVLVRDILGPLRMDSANFGGTGTVGQVDQPWPHLANDKPAPRNGPSMDNPGIMAAAGGVHATLEDYGKFVREHLRGARGEGTLLKPETYARLHAAPYGDGYACGWMTAHRDWGGKVLNHAGSNTMNYVVTWIAPEKDFAVVVALNVGDDAAAKTADGIAWSLIEEYLLKAEPTE